MPETRGAFHAGERALQGALAERMAEAGARAIRDHLPRQHRDFFAQLPFIVVGSLDAQGRPWASALASPPGFVQAPDEHTLRIGVLPLPGDPLAAALAPGAPLGLLGIEPATRRRNRANGVVAQVDARGFGVAVRQSFGNCPRYIQAREAVFGGGAPAAPAEPLPALDAAARALIARADTFFIATAHPDARRAQAAAAEGVDVSHRGGRPGFVHVDEGDVLTVPDFDGNRYFNTLGNLLLHPHAGLLFIDFDGGGLLHLQAGAELVTDGPALAAFEGAQRLLRLRVHGGLRRPGALPLRWGPAAPSPHLAATGRWPASGI